MGALEFASELTLSACSSRMAIEFEPHAHNTLWLSMCQDKEGGTHNFSLALLDSLQQTLTTFKQNNCKWAYGNQVLPVNYVVLKSNHLKYFNLGGDLAHFRACIARKDRQALYQYSKLCLDIMYALSTAVNQQATTISLVQGRALGGGFEAALSADFIIAEEHSEFGFPEIMFGLFPCTGGMSLLARRVGVHEAERMMSNGRIYTATELKEKGVIDEICLKGEGIVAVEDFIATHAKRRAARMMMQRARHRLSPLSYEELLQVVHDWVELAMSLTAEELRVMEMLVSMQKNT